jgi:hypothetical protein
MERIYRSGEVDSLLPAALALVAATQFFNSTLTTLVNKEYGAATTGIVTSFEIIFTWLAAVAIFHVSDVLHLQTLASLGALPLSLSPARGSSPRSGNEAARGNVRRSFADADALDWSRFSATSFPPSESSCTPWHSTLRFRFRPRAPPAPLAYPPPVPPLADPAGLQASPSASRTRTCPSSGPCSSCWARSPTSAASGP